MLIKLVVFGALGYAGYKYLVERGHVAPRRHAEPALVPVAGGPLSAQATLQHSADEPPPVKADPPDASATGARSGG